MNHARISSSSSRCHLVHANKTRLRLTEARKGRENRGPQGRDNSLLHPEDRYFELVKYKISHQNRNFVAYDYFLTHGIDYKLRTGLKSTGLILVYFSQSQINLTKLNVE